MTDRRIKKAIEKISQKGRRTQLHSLQLLRKRFVVSYLILFLFPFAGFSAKNKFIRFCQEQLQKIAKGNTEDYKLISELSLDYVDISISESNNKVFYQFQYDRFPEKNFNFTLDKSYSRELAPSWIKQISGYKIAGHITKQIKNYDKSMIVGYNDMSSDYIILKMPSKGYESVYRIIIDRKQNAVKTIIESKYYREYEHGINSSGRPFNESKSRSKFVYDLESSIEDGYINFKYVDIEQISPIAQDLKVKLNTRDLDFFDNKNINFYVDKKYIDDGLLVFLPSILNNDKGYFYQNRAMGLFNLHTGDYIDLPSPAEFNKVKVNGKFDVLDFRMINDNNIFYMAQIEGDSVYYLEKSDGKWSNKLKVTAKTNFYDQYIQGTDYQRKWELDQRRQLLSYKKIQGDPILEVEEGDNYTEFFFQMDQNQGRTYSFKLTAPGTKRRITRRSEHNVKKEIIEQLRHRFRNNSVILLNNDLNDRFHYYFVPFKDSSFTMEHYLNNRDVKIVSNEWGKVLVIDTKPENQKAKVVGVLDINENDRIIKPQYKNEFAPNQNVQKLSVGRARSPFKIRNNGESVLFGFQIKSQGILSKDQNLVFKEFKIENGIPITSFHTIKNTTFRTDGDDLLYEEVLLQKRILLLSQYQTERSRTSRLLYNLELDRPFRTPNDFNSSLYRILNFELPDDYLRYLLKKESKPFFLFIDETSSILTLILDNDPGLLWTATKNNAEWSELVPGTLKDLEKTWTSFKDDLNNFKYSYRYSNVDANEWKEYFGYLTDILFKEPKSHKYSLSVIESDQRSIITFLRPSDPSKNYKIIIDTSKKNKKIIIDNKKRIKPNRKALKTEEKREAIWARVFQENDVQILNENLDHPIHYYYLKPLNYGTLKLPSELQFGTFNESDIATGEYLLVVDSQGNIINYLVSKKSYQYGGTSATRLEARKSLADQNHFILFNNDNWLVYNINTTNNGLPGQSLSYYKSQNQTLSFNLGKLLDHKDLTDDTIKCEYYGPSFDDARFAKPGFSYRISRKLLEDKKLIAIKGNQGQYVFYDLVNRKQVPILKELQAEFISDKTQAFYLDGIVYIKLDEQRIYKIFNEGDDQGFQFKLIKDDSTEFQTISSDIKNNPDSEILFSE